MTNQMLEGPEDKDGPNRAQINRDPEKREKHWTEKMILAYEEGCSDAEVIKICGITRKEFDVHMETPAFAELVQRGRDYAEAWWLEQGRKAVKDKNNTFPQSLWFNCMTNKYGWASKSDSKNANLEASLSVDKLKEELRKALPDIQKMVNVVELDPAQTRKVISGGK